jgi:glycosyltransferase involved in cell wall biosynthesis
MEIQQEQETQTNINMNLNNYKILVVMPAYNAEVFIKEAVDSILNQKVNLTLIVTDDNSSDSTYKILSQYKKIKLLRNANNMGTYFSLNRAILEASIDKTWTHYLIHGADDISHPNRFTEQLKMLNSSNSNILATGCRFNRINYKTKLIKPTNPNTNESMLLMKREVFEILGYFDNARAACDTEFKQRLLLARPNCINNVSNILVNAYLHDSNLTKKIPIGGDYRKKYVNQFRAKHEHMKKNKNYYQDFNP